MKVDPDKVKKEVTPLVPQASHWAQDAASFIVAQLKQKRDVSEEEENLIRTSAAFGAGSVTAWLISMHLMPAKARARFIFWALVCAIVLLASLGAYCWFVIGFNNFKTFWAFWVPSLIALGLSALKAFKMWTEARRNLAEARKAEAETEKIKKA